jgi:phosphatidylserine synthase
MRLLFGRGWVMISAGLVVGTIPFPVVKAVLIDASLSALPLGVIVSVFILALLFPIAELIALAFVWRSLGPAVVQVPHKMHF